MPVSNERLRVLVERAYRAGHQQATNQANAAAAARCGEHWPAPAGVDSQAPVYAKRVAKENS